MGYIRIAWRDESVLDCFNFFLGSRLAGKSVKSYKKWSFFSIFSPLGPFPQVFGQIKA